MSLFSVACDSFPLSTPVFWKNISICCFILFYIAWHKECPCSLEGINMGPPILIRPVLPPLTRNCLSLVSTPSSPWLKTSLHSLNKYSLSIFFVQFLFHNHKLNCKPARLGRGRENMEPNELQREHEDYRTFQADGGEGVLFWATEGMVWWWR